MEFDEGIDKITTWVKLNSIIKSQEWEEMGDEIDALMPYGWNGLQEVLLDYCNDVGLIHIVKVSVEKGLLRFVSVARGAHHERTFNILAHHVAVKSSLKCMICGKRGYRRKLSEGWPSLCTTHHVQYVNYLDELENVR